MHSNVPWWLTLSVRTALVCSVALTGTAAISCGGGSETGSGGGTGTSAGGSTTTGEPSTTTGNGGSGGGENPVVCEGVTCSGHGKCVAANNAPVCNCDSGYIATDPQTCAPSEAPTIGGCQILPSDHIFNTPIDKLPVDKQSAQFLDTIGNHKLHIDLGQSVDVNKPDEYYGIPYNVVHGGSMTWAQVHYFSTDPEDGATTDESDCADASSGSKHTVVSPCLASAAPQPVFPIPATPLVEGAIDTDPSQPYGDHHTLLLDADSCRLWELYHVFPHAGGGGWDIWGSATFDLGSNKLRPDDWSSSDAAGFPILPLLLRVDEASSGEIKHALRFTILSSRIREAHIWPARHTTHNGTGAAELPPMGQLFRIKASYTIPANFNTQSRAILQALKTYGMYIADGGSNMFIQGEPSPAWEDDTFDQVQSVGNDVFEAVDLTPIHQRAGFDPNSAAVPK